MPSGPDAVYDLIATLRSPRAIRFGALKVLYAPDDSRARAGPQALERMAKELQAYHVVEHSNLLQLLASKPEDRWFVTEYHERGTLNEHLSVYAGRPIAALGLFRPVVEALSKLHRAGITHRDIKPANILVSRDGQLILGDLGLAFFEDSDDSRVTNTHSNVGTRDWMPPWAIGVRIEDVKPTFDVYAMAKVLWSLVTGKPTSPSRYSDSSGHAVQATCGDTSDAAIDEEDCLPDADALLVRIDAAIEETRYVNAPVHLRMAAHAFSRGGGLALFSIEAPIRPDQPVCQPSRVSGKQIIRTSAIQLI